MRSFTLVMLFCFVATFQSIGQRINEFHYDNIGEPDVDEFIEIVLPEGSDPLNYIVYGLNGSLSTNIFTDQFLFPTPAMYTQTINGEDYYVFLLEGFNNGARGGIALVENTDKGCNVLDFISYEGVMDFDFGCGSVLTSVDVMVEQSDIDTPIGASIQWTGNTWIATDTNTRGGLNVNDNAVPTMGQWMFFILGLMISVVGVTTLYNHKGAKI